MGETSDMGDLIQINYRAIYIDIIWTAADGKTC